MVSLQPGPQSGSPEEQMAGADDGLGSRPWGGPWGRSGPRGGPEVSGSRQKLKPSQVRGLCRRSGNRLPAVCRGSGKQLTAGPEE